MTQARLSEAQLQELEDGLRKLGTPGMTFSKAITGEDIETEFCTVWPKAEPILKLVAQYIVLIPGVGPVAGKIINGLVAAGDAMSNAVCPKT